MQFVLLTHMSAVWKSFQASFWCVNIAFHSAVANWSSADRHFCPNRMMIVGCDSNFPICLYFHLLLIAHVSIDKTGGAPGAIQIDSNLFPPEYFHKLFIKITKISVFLIIFAKITEKYSALLLFLQFSVI